MTMNKSQAKTAITNGERVTHNLFDPDEWVELSGKDYVFEDECRDTPQAFWSIRQDSWWNDGWSIVQK